MEYYIGRIRFHGLFYSMFFRCMMSCPYKCTKGWLMIFFTGWWVSSWSNEVGWYISCCVRDVLWSFLSAFEILTFERRALRLWLKFFEKFSDLFFKDTPWYFSALNKNRDLISRDWRRMLVIYSVSFEKIKRKKYELYHQRNFGVSLSFLI